jgi:predicted ABC-type ATPase
MQLFRIFAIVMADKHLYIISGPNGAGKTTASMTLLPEVWQCREFVNADAIAVGLSPFNPDSMAIEAGKLMLKRIDDLLSQGETFAIETTLAAKSYVNLIRRAKELEYSVSLLFLWLESPENAICRVALRVSEGGHNIPEDVILRRYYAGLNNLFQLFMPIVDYWMLVDNTRIPRVIVAEGGAEVPVVIRNVELYQIIKGYVK